MALTHVQRENIRTAMAMKPKGFMRTAPRKQRPIALDEETKMLYRLKAMTKIEQLYYYFGYPVKEWSVGLSRLVAGNVPSAADAMHLKQLGKASAMVDQFCVGISVSPYKKRIYLGMRRVDLTETAQLPEVDTVVDVLDELATNSPHSSIYAQLAYEDGTYAWTDFSGLTPVNITDDDLPYCEALMDGQDGGFVVVYEFRESFCCTSKEELGLASKVGVRMEEGYQTRHDLSMPFRDWPLDGLVAQVGSYFRSLQVAKATALAPGKRAKNRNARKARKNRKH